jgi:hypothetical protein
MGCRTYRAYHVRYREPDYVVTPALFAEAPQRVAILPFASRGVDDKIDWKAKACRRVFYQEFCVRDFEDLEMWQSDRLLASEPEEGKSRLGMASTVLKWVKTVDAVGMTSVFDLKAIISMNPVGATDFTRVFSLTRNKLQADACVAGISRSYGRIYAVIFSTIGVSTRIEMRSSATGELLWRGQSSVRNYEVPLTLNPFDLPTALYYTWRNSSGMAMDVLTYDAYHRLVATIPYVQQPSAVRVKTVCDAPYFHRPTLWMFRQKGVIPRDTRVPFLLEQNGWLKCGLPDGKEMWILKSDGEIMDDFGRCDFSGKEMERSEPKDDHVEPAVEGGK